jgi:hypothetical protein
MLELLGKIKIKQTIVPSGLIFFLKIGYFYKFRLVLFSIYKQSEVSKIALSSSFSFPISQFQEETIMHKTQKLTLTALFAALSYAVFTFLQIKIPIGADATSIHLGNAVVVIAALVLGGPLGGFAGALGMTIGDLLDPVYISYAPKTLICKMVIGLIVGFVAHKLGKIQDTNDKSKIFKWVLLSAICGLFANVILDPSIGYFYKLLILGKPAAELSFKINLMATGINAITSTIVSVFVYMGLYPILRKQNMDALHLA